ncbi:MAG: LysR family transcriptional regulator [Planctomycetia bacterium]|nr:LysR family transcriptional regulator [Planctomycetia bacterium]
MKQLIVLWHPGVIMARRSYKDITLAQLRSFCEVCRQQGFAPAARALHLSGPAVWEQVQALERELGVELFQRHQGGVVATPAGQRTLAMMQPLLDGLDSARQVLREEQGVAPTEIRLVSDIRMLQEEVACGLVPFQQQYPTVRLVLFHPREEDLDHLVASGAADLGLTFDPGPGHAPPATIVHEAAYELDYLMVAPPEHPLAKKSRLQLRHLVQYPLILNRPEDYSRQRFEAVLHEKGLLGMLRVAVETSTASVSLNCVRAGLGAAVVVANSQGFLCHALRVKPLRCWLGPARFVFVWKRGAYRPPSHLQVAACIRAAAHIGCQASRSRS